MKNKYNLLFFAAISMLAGCIGVSCGKTAVAKGAHAGNLVREIAKIAGGNGGGKPDLAMAGGKDISKIKEALAAAENIVSAQIGA